MLNKIQLKRLFLKVKNWNDITSDDITFPLTEQKVNVHVLDWTLTDWVHDYYNSIYLERMAMARYSNFFKGCEGIEEYVNMNFPGLPIDYDNFVVNPTTSIFEVELYLLLIPGFLFFLIGFFAIAFSQKNILIILMAIELLLLGISLNLIIFSLYWTDPRGHILVLLIMSVAAAEVVIALAISVALYRKSGSININTITKLKG